MQMLVYILFEIPFVLFCFVFVILLYIYISYLSFCLIKARCCSVVMATSLLE